MSQIYKNANAIPGGSINTLSAQGGALTPPSGTNFNFTGAVTTATAAGGPLLFSTPSDGQMTATLQIDGSTITTNASNQLVAINGATIWSVETVDLTAVQGHGYFAADPGAGPGSLQVLLPSLADVGDTFFVKDINGNGFIITQNALQFIQIMGQSTTVGATGSIIAIGSGASVEIVCSVANTQFEVVSFDGNINVL